MLTFGVGNGLGLRCACEVDSVPAVRSTCGVRVEGLGYGYSIEIFWADNKGVDCAWRVESVGRREGIRLSVEDEDWGSG